MKGLHPRLAEILRSAEVLLGSIESRFDGGTVLTVEEMLRNAQSVEEDRERRVRLNVIAGELANWFKSLPASRMDANAQVIVRDTQAFAYLTLTPARSGGRTPSFQDLVAQIGQAGIREGINYSALEAAYDKFTKKSGIIYQLKFAECVLPTRGEPGRVEFVVEPFPKGALFDPQRPFAQALPTGVRQVTPGQVVARVIPGIPGRPGRSVRGEEIPALPADPVKVRPGAGLRRQRENSELAAITSGVLVDAGGEIDVVPFYIVAGDLGQGQDLKFNGHVLILGNLVGPCSVECEDLYVHGNLEGGTADCSGDAFIQGGIVGKRTGRVSANGSVYCRFISDGIVEAMGDVVVRDSIAYSEVTSNGRLLVTSEQGAIFGGTVAALKEIRAWQIGSDFAAYTTTIAGKDFLTTRRLARIEQKMRNYEEMLAKISLIKKRLAERDISVASLPPDQQDVYVALLQREAHAVQELNSLRRSKERFDRAMQDFLTASIEAMKALHPPVKVQICSAVEEITQRMQRVTLVLDQGNRVFAMARES